MGTARTCTRQGYRVCIFIKCTHYDLHKCIYNIYTFYEELSLRLMYVKVENNFGSIK